MNHAVVFAALVLAATRFAAADAPTIVVSPTGDDGAAGTRQAPLATLEAARDKLRTLDKSAGATIELLGGVYELAQAVSLTAEDSGVPGAPVVIRSAAGEEARIIGGRVITGFAPVGAPAILDRLLPEARLHVVQVDLRALGITDYGSPAGGGLAVTFDDAPLTVARWPNEGFMRITGLVGGEPVDVRGTKGDQIGKFMYEGDRPERWAAENDLWVHGYWFWDWSDERHRVESIDTEQRIISVEPPYHGYGYRVGQWFYAFNVLAELDTPGEWYLDRESGILYLWPPADIADAHVVVSTAPSLITMDGASYVTLHGLSFEVTRDTAISISGGEGCRIEKSLLRNIGGQAISVNGGRDHGVIGCDIHAVGRGGISLSGGDRLTLTPGGHFAQNNHIYDYGRWWRMYQAAISLNGVGLRASHNLIHDAPHMAIGFGGNDHIIELNEIHNVCLESNDAGAMYAGRDWTMRGTVIRHNFLHHINGFEGRGCVGVYLDDMFCGTQIHGNVFHKVTMAAFIGGGRDCAVTNNIFVDCLPAVHVDDRAMNWAAYHVDTTMKERLDAMPFQDPPWRDRYPELLTLWDDDPAAPKGNLVARNVSVGGAFDGIQGGARPFVTVEDNLVDVDPGFVDLEGGDFGLRADSPAFDMGFEPIPFHEIGLFEDELRATWPVTHVVGELPPGPEPPPVKGPAPRCVAPRLYAQVTIDGDITGAEWDAVREAGTIVLAQDVSGREAGPPSRVLVAHDDEALYVAFENETAEQPPVSQGARWGQDDAVEVALRVGPDAPTIVLRGYTTGNWETSDEAGAPPAAAERAAQGVAYSARVVSPALWLAEWRIPFAGLGDRPAEDAPMGLSLTVRKTAQSLWLMWEGTRGYSWEVDRAGLLTLAP